MRVKDVVSELFRARPEVSFIGYIPVAIVLVVFGMMGMEEDGLLAALFPYALLLLICFVQMRFRTLAGWLLLLAAAVSYAVTVALHPETAYGHYGEYAFFTACGAVPAAFLFLSVPRRKRRPPESVPEGSK